MILKSIKKTAKNNRPTGICFYPSMPAKHLKFSSNSLRQLLKQATYTQTMAPIFVLREIQPYVPILQYDLLSVKLLFKLT